MFIRILKSIINRFAQFNVAIDPLNVMEMGFINPLDSDNYGIHLEQ